jgi:hypothetical protein
MQGPITILNKLKHQDSSTGLDVWYKTIMKDIKYTNTKVTSVVGTEVSMGQQFIILIPFTGKYLPYAEWKNSNQKDNTFTISQGDYIFLGSELEEEITPNNILKTKTKYEPNVCEVRSIEEVPQKYGVKIQLRISGV